MSIYHCTIKMHGQSSGRSCMAKIAYRAGDNLRDPETGKKYNFKNKSSVVFSDIKLPECAPSEWNDRQTLWAEVMKKENESNSQYMREIQPAWPNEWSNEDCIAATKKMADWLCNTYNIPVDYSYEDKHTINPKTMEEIINKHSHICMPTRQLDENGERLPAPFKTGFDNVDEYLDKIYAAHVKRTPEPARGTVRVISAAERQSWYEIGKLAGFPPAEIDRLFDVERFKPFSEKQLAYQSIKASREQFWREWKKKKAEIDRETNRAYKGRSKLRKAEWILHSKSPSWGQIIYAVIVLAKNRNAERDIELLKEVRDELYSDMREFKATTGATKSLLRDRDIRLDGYIEALRAAENKADRIYEQAEQEEKQNGYSALDELVRRAEAKKKPEQTNRPDKNKDHNLTY